MRGDLSRSRIARRIGWRGGFVDPLAVQLGAVRPGLEEAVAVLTAPCRSLSTTATCTRQRLIVDRQARLPILPTPNGRQPRRFSGRRWLAGTPHQPPLAAGLRRLPGWCGRTSSRRVTWRSMGPARCSHCRSTRRSPGRTRWPEQPPLSWPSGVTTPFPSLASSVGCAEQVVVVQRERSRRRLASETLVWFSERIAPDPGVPSDHRRAGHHGKQRVVIPPNGTTVHATASASSSGWLEVT